MKSYLRTTIFLLFLFGISGCTRMIVGSIMQPTVDNLQQQTDLELVCDGTPAFLLMIDSMLASDPDDESLLLTATQAFTAYTAALDACGRPERAMVISEKAKKYGLAFLSQTSQHPFSPTTPLPDFQQTLAAMDTNDVPALFWAGNGWATWIRYQGGSPASMAQLVRVEQMMLRLVELDETYYQGGGHIFLGVYYGSKPPLLGGKPELSRAHFEKALAIGNREFLPTQVAYAETYAKMTYNRDLFEQLLQEVVSFSIEKRPDIALINQVAKRRAAQLLEQADQFF
jgi:hypothetical protein